MNFHLKMTLAAAAIAGSAVASAAAPYTVTANLTPDEDGAMAFLVNLDNGNKIDSVLVTDSKAAFAGNIESPVIARLLIDGKRYGQMIIEEGNVVYDLTNRTASGTPLNDRANSIGQELAPIGRRAQEAKTEAEFNAALSDFVSLLKKNVAANADNALGLDLFLDLSSYLEPAEFDAMVARYPALARSTRVQKLIETNKRRAITQPGNKMVDFEVTHNGVTKRLSDYVGKGHYTLVDYWASWCGPCIRQTAVLKDIYHQYKDKGLEVLGVAVWDKPEDTEQAIVKHELPWECIINAQTIPTDLYGISGIPCIILYGPDGTILSRDKQDEALRADVKAAMEGTLKVEEK